MKIKIEKLDERTVSEKGIKNWPIWEKEISSFDWHYDSIEECLLLEGSVEVEMPDGDTVKFGAGDFVTFPKGLSCRWRVIRPVKKHYSFSE